MGLTEQTAEPADLRNLSDKELVGRFCAQRTDQPAAEELWRRHNSTIYESLQKYTRALCPAFYERGDLVHNSYLQARENLLNRICMCRELDSARSFKAWLDRVARSTMLDVRRRITRSRSKRKIVEVSIEKPCHEEDEFGSPAGITEEMLLELPPTAVRPASDPVSFPGDFERRSHHEYFRSRYSTSPLDPSSPVEWKIVERQRKLLFREVLTRHAEQSEEDAICAAMIRLRFWSKWEVAKILAHLYGESLTRQQQQARHKAYYRLLNKDYEGIRKDLERVHIVKEEQV